MVRIPHCCSPKFASEDVWLLLLGSSMLLVTLLEPPRRRRHLFSFHEGGGFHVFDPHCLANRSLFAGLRPGGLAGDDAVGHT